MHPKPSLFHRPPLARWHWCVLSLLAVVGMDLDRAAAQVTQDTLLIPGTETALIFSAIPGARVSLGQTQGEVDEAPQHAAEISPFAMMTTEVTAAQFGAFRYREQDGSTASYDADIVTRPSPPYEDPAHGLGSGAARPATGMTQWAALQYAQWIYQKTGVFVRLPTEAEWEYACADAAGHLSEGAWYRDTGNEALRDVGMGRANQFGLFDMLGNAAEWTLDEYRTDAYRARADGQADPLESPTRLHPRVVRGGSFDDDAAALTCSNRTRSSLAWKRRDPQIPKSKWWNTDSPFLGFRLVRPALQPSPEDVAAFFDLHLSF